MATTAQRLAGLEQQVAELAARLELYHQQAAMISVLNAIDGPAPPAGDARQMSARRTSIRPRHLTVVGGRS